MADLAELNEIVLVDQDEAGGTPDEVFDTPRPVHQVGRLELIEFAGPALGAVAAAFTITRFFGWTGILGPALLGLVVFIVIYSQVARASLGAEAATDRIITVLVFVGALTALATLSSLVLFVVVKGVIALRPAFFAQDMSTTGPLNPGGGARHAIIGTLEQCGLAALIAVPLAILSAIYLNEIKGQLANPVRFLVDAMSGVPSIVAGLFVYAFWVVGLGRGYSGVAAALALVVLMLPTVTRTSEEVLRTIPDSLREASLSLGAPQWRTVLRIVLPTARSGLITAVLLGIARIVGETAPVLFTAKGSPSTNLDPTSGQQAALPQFIYSLLRQPNKNQLDRAYAGALVLLILVALLFAMARLAGAATRRKV